MLWKNNHIKKRFKIFYGIFHLQYEFILQPLMLNYVLAAHVFIDKMVAL